MLGLTWAYGLGFLSSIPSCLFAFLKFKYLKLRIVRGFLLLFVCIGLDWLFAFLRCQLCVEKHALAKKERTLFKF